MNDCVWCVSAWCDCMGRCKHYLSINTEEGQRMEEKYDNDVEEALKPIREKYKAIRDAFFTSTEGGA